MLARAAAFAVVSAVAWTAGVRDAAACSCAPATACLRWGRSTAVFVGDVIDVQGAERSGITARLRVVRAFKGVREAAIVSIDGGLATCELRFAAGQRWVVYADTGPRGLRSSLCSGSRQLDANAALPDLRPEAGVVDGWLLRPRAEPGVQPWVEGAPVWIDAPSGRIASRTGAQGSFRLTGVPAGTWKVAFDLGGRETAEARATVASPDRCATVEALAEPAPR
jgi:hypothetical protein